MSQPIPRRVPTLLSLCQKVATANAHLIDTLGDIDYQLVKPILQSNVETLQRLEDISPHLKNHTGEIWQSFCRQTSITPISTTSDDIQLPSNWKDQYYFLLEEEAQRINEAGNRIKSQISIQEQLKREREIKYTDRIPQAKRTRWSQGPTPPKSLFQRTRVEAVKVHRTIVHKPSPPKSKPPILVKPSAVLPVPPPSSNTQSRVKVATVVRRAIPPPQRDNPAHESPVPRNPPQHPPTTTTTSPTKPSKPSYSSLFIPKHRTTLPQLPDYLTKAKSTPTPTSSSSSSSSPQKDSTRPIKSLPVRKDPMASMFMPKQKVSSQLRRPKAC